MSTAEKPHLSHSPSNRSFAATSDHASSENASSPSSDKTQITALRYESPPSRTTTPPTDKELEESEMPFPQKPSPARHAPSRATSSSSPPPPPVPPTEDDRVTPGIDNTPYIRFGLNQLTIDEEVAGKGRYSSTNGDYQVERVVPDQNLGYYQPGSLTVDTLPPPPQRQPTNSRQHSRMSTRRPKAPIYVATDPSNTNKYPKLTYVPLLLRTLPVVLFFLICLLAIAALIFCNLHSSRSNGLWSYDRVGDRKYFVFQFLPQFIGVFVLLWIFALQSALYRCLPFLVLASGRRSDRVMQDVPLLPRNFVWPDFTLFRHGEFILGLCLLVFWLMNFTIPLLACAFQTKVLDFEGLAQWRWTSVQGVVWALVVFYAILAIALLTLLWWFYRRQTGLMWDPASLADVIPMFQKSNIILDYDRSEISGSIQTHIPARTLHLRYWRLSNSSQPFYAVAEEDQRQNRPSFEAGTTIEKPSPDRIFDIEQQRYSNAESFSRHIHSPYIRYRWTPWFLRDSAIVAWTVIAAILFIAFLVVSFVNSAVRDGFSPHLSTAPDDDGFSSSNFLFSFIPALLATFLALAYQPIDFYFRAIQPFASLSSWSGTSARNSLLLSYPSQGPFSPVLAILNRHYKTAFISLVALTSFALPILAGGVFTALSFPGPNATSQIRIVAFMPAFYALIAFLAVYVLSFLAVWPTRKRYLPHAIYTLADLLSFVYQSPLLTDTVFRDVMSKQEIVKRLTDNGDSQRFTFGIFVGRDGHEHLGIDRLQRPGSGENLIGPELEK